MKLYDILFDYVSGLAFNTVYRAVKRDDKNQTKNQKKILKFLLKSLQRTQFWNDFKLDKVCISENIYSDFCKSVPIFEYKDFRDYIELSKEKENIIRPWKIRKFSASSWTTWNKKHIPVTNEAMKSTTKVWAYMFAEILRWYKWIHFLRWDFFPLTWTIQENNGSYKVWDVSALILLERKWATASRYSLPKSVLLNPSWEDKIKIVYEKLDENRENTMVGVTSWAYEILNYIETRDFKKFEKLVKSMELIIWWWVDVAPYMHYFKQHNIKYMWAYNASEWYFGYQDIINYDNSNGDAPYKLLTNHGIFYEFLELNSENFDDEWNVKKTAKAKPIREIKQRDIWKKFALVITTNAWLVRYLIGDVISFVDENLRFKIVWRTRQSINLKWEELMETHVNSVIEKLSKDDGISITYYTIWPDSEDWPTRHEWVIELEKKSELSDEDLTKKIDSYLQEINPDYKAKRKNDMLLKMPVIHFVKKWTFYDRLKSNNKLWSQVKVPKLSHKRVNLEEILKMK